MTAHTSWTSVGEVLATAAGRRLSLRRRLARLVAAAAAGRARARAIAHGRASAPMRRPRKVA